MREDRSEEVREKTTKKTETVTLAPQEVEVEVVVEAVPEAEEEKEVTVIAALAHRAMMHRCCEIAHDDDGLRQTQSWMRTQRISGSGSVVMCAVGSRLHYAVCSSASPQLL